MQSGRQAKEVAIGRGGGQLGWHRSQGDRGHGAPGLNLMAIFLTPALGFWPCFLGQEARHLPWEQGLTTCGLDAEDFGAHFPCP